MDNSILVRVLIANIILSLIIAKPFRDLDTDFLFNNTKTEKSKKVLSKKDKTDDFETVIKDFPKIDGMFTIYWDKEKNQAYLSIKPEQLEIVYLSNVTRQTGDAHSMDASSMMNTFPFMFKKVGNQIQFTNVNVKFRADENSAISNSLENSLSNSLMGSASIKSTHPKNGNILIDLADLFMKSTEFTARSNENFTLDKSNSYYNELKSFPNNTEIDVVLHMKTRKPNRVYTLPSSRSMLNRYHISLSKIQNSNFKPRLSDDRIGYFTTSYVDYTNTLEESGLVQYINRWNIEKANPRLKLSKPIKPIVYWIENTVPIEFRDAVREGILLWNSAFEKIGIRDAIVVKQMADDAEWDPADSRYSTIRWIIQPGASYAVGPSRANPYTGEIYDADIRISADFVRFYYNEFEEFVSPIIDDLSSTESEDNHHCAYADNLQEQMAFALSSMVSSGFTNDLKTSLDQFIHDALVDLVVHEVGHTLGLRHNFKASSAYSIEEVANPEFTKTFGTTSSVMDYNAISLLDGGTTYFQTRLGKYDYWAIEYGYSIQTNNSKLSEPEFLNNIAKHSVDPQLAYGTDEDSYGSRNIDPLISKRDLTNDPIAFHTFQLNKVNEYWDSLLVNFEENSIRYPRLRKVFEQGFGEYFRAIGNVTKYIGGIYHSRHHILDDNQKPPMKIVEATNQRRALEFIDKFIFDKDVFNFSPELLNKLAPERIRGIKGTIPNANPLDYPIHKKVKALQTTTIFYIFNNKKLERIQNNEVRFLKNEEVFTMSELFLSVKNSVWSELPKIKNINSFRRELQRIFLNRLYDMILQENEFPKDAVALSFEILNTLKVEINSSLKNNQLDQYTRAHLHDCIHRIDSVLDAHINLN